MKVVLKNRLALKLAWQMIIVVIIISLVFTVVIHMQTKEVEKRILDKARLFSLILGVNLDKVFGDNLTAYERLQQEVEAIISEQAAVEEIRVIAPELIILASTRKEETWQPLGASYLSTAREVLETGQPYSFIKRALGKEVVVHFMPLKVGPAVSRPIGVMQVNVRFPSQQGESLSSVRMNKSAYYRKEASLFSTRLAESLSGVFQDVQRNFEYVEGLVQNIRSDEEIQDIRLFSKDLRMIISGSAGRRSRFITQKKTSLYEKAMREEEPVRASVEGRQDLMEIVSPLYLKEVGKRKVGGAVSIVLSMQRMKALMAERRHNILSLSFVIASVFCLLIGLFFKRRVLAPLTDLMALTERMARGDFSHKVSISSRDEIGQLSEAFNRMAEELRKSKKALDEFNLHLQERVENISQELQEKQAQLLETEKLASLGILSSGIAHEINNPLGIILGNAQILLTELRQQGKLLDFQEAQKLLEAVESYTKRCSHIVKGLLQFAGRKNLECEQMDISETLENAFEFTSGRLAKKEIRVSRLGEEDLPFISGDPIQLEQVFVNIILNAEQSMEVGGTLKVTTSCHGEAGHKEKYLWISFEDTGAGISSEVIGKIFDPFFSTKEPGVGAGLGLSVSYGIIKEHGGDIEIKSKDGVGTHVVVKLPVGQNGDRGQ